MGKTISQLTEENAKLREDKALLHAQIASWSQENTKLKRLLKHMLEFTTRLPSEVREQINNFV